MSGGFNPINLVSQAALAAVTGGTSMLIQAAVRAVVSAVVQQVIQQVAQQLGLPPQVIGLAQQAFQAASGNAGGAAQGVGGLAQSFSQQALGNFATQGVGGAIQNLGQLTNLSASQQGQISRAADKAMASMTTELVKQGLRQATEEIKAQAKKDKEDGAISTKGKSFLMAIAQALGATVDSKMNQMVELSGKIKGQVAQNDQFTSGFNSKTSNGDLAKANTNSQKLGTYTSELQAVSQELSILQNVISTTLKSVGEAQSTIARKG